MKKTKKPVVKYKSQNLPEKILKAATKGSKFALPHRSSAVIDTGVEVKVESGYRLCFSLVASLANRGLISTNAPGNIQNGKVLICVLNCGREIVEVKDGDPVVEVWLEADHNFEWEAE